MAHEIYQTSNGKDSMAYVGLVPWHGLGQKLTPGADITTWMIEAGFNWSIKEGKAQFFDEFGQCHIVPNQRVLYRSDNGQALSIVSDRYQIVQPREIIDFFAEFCESGDMTLETAGTLGNGGKMWALAKIDKSFELKRGDIVNPYVLLSGSCDKSLATQGMLTTVRVVCNNTLSLALNSSNGGKAKQNHSAIFNPKKIKETLGLIDETLGQSFEAMQGLAKQGVTEEQAVKFFLELVKTDEERRTGEVDIESKKKVLPKMLDSFGSAPGHEPTVWGLVNAVTHSVDFNPSARTDTTRLTSAWFGAGNTLKTKAYELATNAEMLEAIIGETEEISLLDHIIHIESDSETPLLDAILNAA